MMEIFHLKIFWIFLCYWNPYMGLVYMESEIMEDQLIQKVIQQNYQVNN